MRSQEDTSIEVKGDVLFLDGPTSDRLRRILKEKAYDTRTKTQQHPDP